MKKHKTIRILKSLGTDKGWQFTVAVDGTTYSVTLQKTYHEQLTGGKTEPGDLIEASFQYLLDREAKEQILSEFDLAQIELYFPNYPTEVAAYITK